MDKFYVREEKTKVGRKVEVQYAVTDSALDKVIIRYGDLIRAEFVCGQMNDVARLALDNPDPAR